MLLLRGNAGISATFRALFALSFLPTFLAVGILFSSHVLGQSKFDREPVRYQATQPNDAVWKLKRRLESESTKLKWDSKQGWLPDLLEKLEIDSHSQNLVFSKTSLQTRHISPSNPRAIFFNDDIYIGYVPGGDLIEISAVDDQLGAVFYTIKQVKPKADEFPVIRRDENQCLTCHETSKTRDVPGYLVRSVFPSASGHPHYGMGTTTTDPTIEFKKRFGGWYVTGSHGKLRHRGNVIAKKSATSPVDFEAGANRESLPKTVDPSKYPAQSSDIVALMVLEHQSQMHNAITFANFETRQALYQQAVMNKALERESNYRSESTQRRIKAAGDDLLRTLFFCDEWELDDRVVGNTKFSENFEGQGPHDSKKRSLREFDLKTRMFKYPCSYLIYSSSFDRLPAEVRGYVESQVFSILTSQVSADSKTSDPYHHLDAKDRKAILEILLETKPGFKSKFERWKKSREEK